MYFIHMNSHEANYVIPQKADTGVVPILLSGDGHLWRLCRPTSQGHTSVSPSKPSKTQPQEPSHDLPLPQSPAGASKYRGYGESSSYTHSTLQTHSSAMQIYF